MLNNLTETFHIGKTSMVDFRCHNIVRDEAE
jgi:hypothetical protein